MIELRRNKKGQFLIASVVLMAIMIISLASLLASITVTNVQLLKDDFRNEVVKVSSNFRGALAMATAEVSKELEFRSSIILYSNYTTLEDYPEAGQKGLEFMANWHKTMLSVYAGRSLNLSISQLDFECHWNSSHVISKAWASLTFDFLTYGFYGWKQNDTVELTLDVLDLKEKNGKVTFCIRLQKEGGLPATDLTASFVKILYLNQDASPRFVDADSSTVDIAYLGGGYYNVSFSSGDYATPITTKIILRDRRGIVVAAIPDGGVALGEEDDAIGPKTTNALAVPSPCPRGSLANLTATIDDLSTGASNIVCAEYFVDTIGANGNGTSMSASDGYFNSPLENVQAQLDVSSWALGQHTIYVHGKDAKSNWGDLSSVVLRIIETLPTLHVASISMRIDISMLKVRCTATVRIVDANENPVSGAMVYGHWSGSVSGSVNSATGGDGTVTFKSRWISIFDWIFGGHFTFTVDNVSKNGWVYDEAANEETTHTLP